MNEWDETQDPDEPFRQIIKQKLTSEEMRGIAEAIDAHIRQKSPNSVRNEKELRQALVNINVRLAEAMVGGDRDGVFLSPEETALLHGQIVISPELRNAMRRLKVIVHETSHALMRDWVAPAVYDADEVICTRQNTARARHQIAKLVEEKW